MEKFKFNHKGKTYTLFKRTENASYTIRLTGANGKRSNRATGYQKRASAVEKAKELIDAMAANDQKFLDDARLRSEKPATVGEIVDTYDSRQSFVRDSRDNSRALVLIVRSAFQCDLETARSLSSVQAISAETISKYIANTQGRDFPEYVRPLTQNYSINSTIGKARSLFSKKCFDKYHGEIYQDLNIPDVSGFMKCRLTKVAAKATAFRPPPPEKLAEMNRDFNAMRSKDSDLWAAFMMMRYMGMRAGEVFAAKRNWLFRDSADGNWKLSIESRPEQEFTPKNNNSVRNLHIPKALIEHLEPIAEKHHLICPGRAMTVRKKKIYRELSHKLRDYFEGTKTNHELRKLGGSEVAMKYNSAEVAAKWLGDDVATARKHYLHLLKEVTLEPGDIVVDENRGFTVAKSG